jgi:hypothetical protein
VTGNCRHADARNHHGRGFGRVTVRRAPVSGVTELRDLSRAAVSPARGSIGLCSAAGRADLGARFAQRLPGMGPAARCHVPRPLTGRRHSPCTALGASAGERWVPYLQVGELWAVVVLYVLLMVLWIPSR